MTGTWTDIAAGFAAGLALGALHLAWLWSGLNRPGGFGAAGLAGRGLVRIAVVLAGLWLLARVADHPGAALIAALVGLLVARGVAVRAARRGGKGG